jgi:hypothetical protein
MRNGRHVAVLLTAALALSGCGLDDRDVTCGASGQGIQCRPQGTKRQDDRNGPSGSISATADRPKRVIFKIPREQGRPRIGDGQDSKLLLPLVVPPRPKADDPVFGDLPSLKRLLG